MPEARSVAVLRSKGRQVWRAVRRVAHTLVTRTAEHALTRVLWRRWRALPPAHRQSWRLAAGSAAMGLLVACTAVAMVGPWDSGQRTAEQRRAAAPAGGSGKKHSEHGDGDRTELPPPAAPVLAALGPRLGSGDMAGGPGAPVPTVAGLTDVLRPLLDDPVLGEVRTASVVDAATGRQLYGVRADRPVTPASTVKIATAAAALSALGPDHRIRTQVLAAPRKAGDDGGDTGSVVLVGGGDPTLSSRQLAELAGATARALKKQGVDRATVRYDTRLYRGSGRHPIGVNENLSPVSALMVNEGRLDNSHHGPAPRATDPARQAASSFAALLRKRGIAVSADPSRTGERASGEVLATVRSAPLSALVERMLTYSDNDLAEALARQVAIAAGEPADFAGAGRAVRRELAALKVPLSGARFADGSGLSRDSRVSAQLLTGLLVRAADPGRPGLRPVLTGLPVAGFNGTLGGRYRDRAEGAGLVHAKTGTLTGVNTLAGTVVDADGRLLVFAFLSAGAPDRSAAHDALDRLASAVTACGCR